MPPRVVWVPRLRARPGAVGRRTRARGICTSPGLSANNRPPDMLPTSRGATDSAIEPSDWADPMKQVLSAQVPGPSRIPGWLEEVVSAASKLSSMPTPAGSVASSWVWFTTGTLLTL